MVVDGCESAVLVSQHREAWPSCARSEEARRHGLSGSFNNNAVGTIRRLQQQ